MELAEVDRIANTLRNYFGANDAVKQGEFVVATVKWVNDELKVVGMEFFIKIG